MVAALAQQRGERVEAGQQLGLVAALRPEPQQPAQEAAGQAPARNLAAAPQPGERAQHVGHVAAVGEQVALGERELDPVTRRILAGQDARPAGRAHRRGTEGAREADAGPAQLRVVRHQLVEPGRVRRPVLRSALLIGDQQDQVGRRTLRQCRLGTCRSTRHDSRRCWSPSASTGRTDRRTSCSRRCGRSARSTGPRRSPSTPRRTGYWSITRADDVREISLDWETYSSAHGITALTNAIMPVELISAMFIGMDPPKHDRLKALFQRGFTPKRIAEHEDAIREITRRRARPARGARDLRPRHRRRAAGRLARDRQLHGHPARGRRDLGAADEQHARRGRPRPQPGGRRVGHAARRARDLRALRAADRRAPRATRPTT